jgi:hypothetical protein
MPLRLYCAGAFLFQKEKRMNKQLQLPWAQPCQEIAPISKSWNRISIQKMIQQVSCQINKFDHFAQSLCSMDDSHKNSTRQAIIRNILR